MGILSSIIIHTLCNVFLSITMNKVILLCLILAFATTTYGHCIYDCWDVRTACLKECPASQECQDYIEYDQYYTNMNMNPIRFRRHTHPCGKCGDECVVDKDIDACLDKCDEMGAK